MTEETHSATAAIARVEKLFLPPKKHTRAAVLGDTECDTANAARKQCLRDALIAVYAGLKYDEDAERKFGWAWCVVARLHKQMPAGLKDSDNTLSLTRCASKLAGLAPRQCYREAELKEALRAIFKREVFAPRAEELCGPPAKTLNNWK
jgi:hypothetical protein